MKSFQLTTLLILILHVFSAAQNNTITIKGTVKDQTTGAPIPYATVVISDQNTESMISGAATQEDGTFSVTSNTADIFITISFMGYETKKLSNLSIQNNQVDLGTLALIENSQVLEEVMIVGEKSTMEFDLDKRVFNVGSDISSTGVSALEVLNKVPSVNVDIEGQIQLRGNSGVKILLNGKPSVLADEESNALGTITADMIERIEVITNPSAKYDAEGTAGILNIILKKEENRGLNGSVTANTGLPDNHSIGLSMNKRTDRFNLFTQLGGGYRSYPYDRKSENIDRINQTTLVSTGTSYRNELFYNATLGTDYHLNKSNIITLTGNFSYEIEDQPSRTNYNLVDEINQTSSSWYREETTEAINPKWEYDLQYSKEFEDNEDHLLLFNAQGSFFGKDQSSEFTNSVVEGADFNTDQQTRTKFQQADYTFKLDYTNPVNDVITMEAGGQYLINDVGNDYSVSNFADDEWIIDPALTNVFEYNQKVLAGYATGAYKKDKWGIKLGVRVENTDLHTLLTNTDEDNLQNYTDFFPTLHSSYKMSDKVSLQAGYSRRIFRPRLWDLNPFFNIRDNYNIRTGNPNLKAEYSDSYELTSIFKLGKATLNASIFHLFTTNMVERVTSFSDNVQTTIPLNVGTNRATGLEMNGKFIAAEWWTLNGDFNWNFYKREGEYENQSFDFNGNRWSSRLMSSLSLPADFELEITGYYRSGYKTVQSDITGSPSVDVGVRKKINKGKFVINASVRDLFDSRIRESITEKPGYYLYSRSNRRRTFTLGVSYGFGKGEAMTYSSGRRH
ncbi:TonB-dependent receptor family protein [Membranicola marinus]|uniref:TonB-dependent receptor family protein n=1 Tax=Membranihabitans marinus TaxID=1227546 RepID=A0A953LBP1_9BACT|nr:outer membrane beta-barrel family protein [Membranihabitans marinus]MBY5958736.1 TonB-dependent receptor family protein [Membranihabitans marinus]